MTSHKSIMVWGDYGPDSVTGRWSANTYDADDAVKYVPADSKPIGVRVKQLLWDKNDEAIVVSRIYRVWKIHNSDKWLVNTNGYTLGGVLDGQYNRMFGSKVEAKVAAQNHYQAAIGEPIKPAQPDHVGYALSIEQAAQVAVNRHSHWHKLGSDCLVDDDVSACADIAAAIRALITAPQRDALQAVIDAAVAKARAEDAAHQQSYSSAADMLAIVDALRISGPIALADFKSHPFILNNEEEAAVAVITAALTQIGAKP